MALIEKTKVNRVISQVVEVDEFNIKLSHEDAKEIADLWWKSSSVPGFNCYPAQNEAFWRKAKSIFRPLIDQYHLEETGD